MDRIKGGYIEGVVSVVVNTALFGLKMWAGVITNSLALTADAWHTLSDSLSSIVVIIATKLSSRKADKEHPFGHGRWEQISAIFIGVFLAIIAYDFMKESFISFSNKKSTNFGTIAIVVTIISIIVKEALAQYAFYIARKTNNTAIKADAWHHRTDAFSSVVVLVGIFFGKYFWWIDVLLGGVISLLLFYASYEIIKEAISKILGEEPTEELIKKIEIEIKNLNLDEIQPHHYHLHNYISHQELTFHIKMDGAKTLSHAHKVATDIENRILDVFGITSTIHVEPTNFNHKLD